MKKIFLSILRISFLMLMLLGLVSCSHYAGGLVNPKGPITEAEKTLFMDSIALMLIVVIPVIIMSFAFAYRYRAKNKRAQYKPNWSHSTFLETIWWTIPCIIIVILGIFTWKQSHKLDPYRKLDMPGKPLLIQAVALRWKWLFIYPKQNIATVNYIDIPKDRQVQFWITSDAPMSAFFIPQLGSQIYAMAGMRTRLHIASHNTGLFTGLDTQYNGDGFSDMHFKVNVSSKADYLKWVKSVQEKNNKLSIAEYQQIVKPSIQKKPLFYSSVHKGLFNRIMDQYMMPNMRLH